MALMLFVAKGVFSQPSQATMDVGLWGGVNSYQGDMTQQNRVEALSPSGGFLLRYNFNPRYAIRLSGMFGQLAGVGKFDDMNWEFAKLLNDISAVYEFNFWPYLIGNSKRNITTFLTLGVGINSFANESSPSAAIIDGVYFAMAPEGDAVLSAVNIPLGFGFKFNVKKRIGVGAEFVMRKYFDDRLDNLDDPRAFGEDSTQGYNSSMHNNDWTFHLGVFICYQLVRFDKNCALYDE